MYNKTDLAAWCIACSLMISPAGSAAASAGEDGKPSGAMAVLVAAEEFRSPWPEFESTIVLKPVASGSRENEEYSVFVKDKTKTLVSFRSPVKQKGNLLLMVNDYLWFYVKNTARPMRITPLQRLSGGVSYGDIARLNWSQDYDIDDFRKGVEIKFEDAALRSCRMVLKAKSDAATYHKIHLWIDEESGQPKKAEFFLHSGKHMKTVYFTRYEQTSGKMMNREILFVDHLEKNEMTRLTFQNVKTVSVPDKYFQQTNLPDISKEVGK